MKKKICAVIGARPQFIKHAPIEIELKKHFNLITIHTGQHYDKKMSDIFFDQLKMDKPNYMLSIGSGNHGMQTGQMLEKIEEILLKENPDGVLVYGDTNSTLAGALAASKLSIKIIHIEAGLRSFNREMPEEINRILTDHISEILFAPSPSAIENLKKEGIEKNVFKTGDVMMDAVLLAKNVITKDVVTNQHILVTLHRPYNTDNIERLRKIIEVLNGIGQKVIFPAHPRTANVLKANQIELSQYENIQFCDPVSYFDLIKLQMESKCILTDSGGIQKEAYILKKKCITIRTETEWVETLENGWNTLVFENLEQIVKLMDQTPGAYNETMFGNGEASSEIVEIILNRL